MSDRSNRVWIALCVTALAAVATVILGLFVDRAGAAWGLAHRDLQPWVSIRQPLALLGSGVVQPIVLVLFTVVAYALRRRRLGRLGLVLISTLLVATILTTGLKWAVRRPRPEFEGTARPALAEQVHSTEWHSFPSGDVLVTTALITVIWMATGCRAATAWLLVIPLLVGMQRFIAGRHHLSDISAGLVLGAWVGALTARGMKGWVQRGRDGRLMAENSE